MHFDRDVRGAKFCNTQDIDDIEQRSLYRPSFHGRDHKLQLK